MSQPTQNSLIQVLFMWTTILSIVQGVFIVFFFTVGHHGQSQNSSVPVPAPSRQTQVDCTQLPQNCLGEMREYEATEVNGKFSWVDKFPVKGPISIEGDDLKIQEDGYYFLYLQVTLKTEMPCPCNGTRGMCTVSVLKDKQEFLEGWINKNSCSTGLLAKAEKLSAGTILNVTINMPHNQVEENLTHLGIIMLRS